MVFIPRLWLLACDVFGELNHLWGQSNKVALQVAETLESLDFFRRKRCRRSPIIHPIAAKTVSGVHNPYALPGVIIMSGCGIKKGIKIAGAHVYDVAPTILTLLGLPVGADMDGKVLVEALVSGLKATYIKTYESAKK